MAGGDGTRLNLLTEALNGTAVPKQYYPLFGAGDLMLEQTLGRDWLNINRDQTVTVLAGAHQKFYETRGLNSWAGDLVIEPQNRDTTPAILYGFFRLINSSQTETVAVFPCDHYVDNDRRFMSYVEI